MFMFESGTLLVHFDERKSCSLQMLEEDEIQFVLQNNQSFPFNILARDLKHKHLLKICTCEIVMYKHKHVLKTCCRNTQVE